MPNFTEKSFDNIMCGRSNLQHLKALERETNGTLAFTSYLLKRSRIIPLNKAFGSLSLNPPLPEKRRIADIWSAIETKNMQKVMKK
ncbi:MAG: hypothetical protein O8C61_06095 [Candidatus Methanoperedens sp.]|nr:hypothetical protein [Candidatus Methanoperedens sp.]